MTSEEFGAKMVLFLGFAEAHNILLDALGDIFGCEEYDKYMLGAHKQAVESEPMYLESCLYFAKKAVGTI